MVLGLPSLVAGASAYFLPETKGKELPQNMKDTTVKNLDTPLDEDQCENPIIKSWDRPYAVLGPVGKIKISQFVSYWYLKLNLKINLQLQKKNIFPLSIKVIIYYFFSIFGNCFCLIKTSLVYILNFSYTL